MERWVRNMSCESVPNLLYFFSGRWRMEMCEIKKEGDGKISNVEHKHVLHTES